jgi:hypothetical protein
MMGAVRVKVKLQNAIDEALVNRGLLAPALSREWETEGLVDTVTEPLIIEYDKEKHVETFHGTSLHYYYLYISGLAEKHYPAKIVICVSTGILLTLPPPTYDDYKTPTHQILPSC